MYTVNYEDLITDCLKICDEIDDGNVKEFFPKLDNCLELSEYSGNEKLLFQKSMLGLVRRCRQKFLTETKMSLKDVTDYANYFSEYIREMTHLDGLEANPKDYPSTHTSNIDKRECCTPGRQIKLSNYLIILIILALLTLILALSACWIWSMLKPKEEMECNLALPKEIADNLTLTCQELGLDPCDMKVLKEKTCFDKEYENIVNKYLKKREELSNDSSINCP